MSCGGRVYKGDTITISVPFDVDDYSNLTITYTTIGGEKIVKTQEEVEIEDGFITYTFEPGELDLLPDGVIYYAISYEVDGVDHVESTNTNLYLKTPAGYSGRTAEDIYQEGYEAGLEDCSGSSCNLQSKSVVVSANTQTVSPDQGYDGMDSVSIDATSFGNGRYQQGYEAGYDSGYEDAEEDYPRIQPQKNYTADTTSFVIVPNNGYDGMGKVNVNATPVFNQGYQSGYTQGQADCDCSEAYNLGYNDGYEDGRESVTSGCPMQEKSISLSSIEESVSPDYGYAGLSEVHINAQSFYNTAYNDGYAAGLEDCSGSTDCSSAITEAYQSGYTEGHASGYTEGYNQGQADCPECSGGTCNLEASQVTLGYDWTGFTRVYPSQGYDGLSDVIVADIGYGQRKYDEGYADGHTSGYTDGHASGYTEGYDDGYLSGASTTDCSQAISMAYDNGHYLGYNEGKDSVIKSLFTENDTDLVIGYYYTSARTMCLITGEYHDSNIDYDGNSAFVSMSVNGGSWQPVEKYLELPAGWSQVRFSGCTTLLLGAFSHRFTPSQQCDMDALKIVSLPTMVDGLSNTYTFHMNDGLRVIASSCGIMRGATNGADNINVVITHYTGNQREYNYFPSNGVLFIPEGSTADWASILPNWTHIEMF